MKVNDAGDGSSSRKSRWSKRLPQLAKDHSARAGRKVVQPKDSSADSKANRHLGRSDALDREVKGTRQDRSGAREPVQKSASASRSMTHSAPKFLRSPDEEEEKVLDRDPATNASQDGPTRPTDSGEKSGQVQLLGGTTDSDSTEDKGLEAKESQFRADDLRLTQLAKEKEGVETGETYEDETAIRIPPVPDEINEATLEPPDTRQMTSVSREKKDGKTIEKFEHNGVVYTQTTGQSSTTVTYESGGVSYTSQATAHGSTVTAAITVGDVESRRSVTRSSSGEFVSDATSQSQTVTDGRGRQTVKERTVTIGADLNRSTTDTMVGPDGEEVRKELVEAPDGTKVERYRRVADKESQERLTTTSPDGWSETSTQKEATFDGRLEDYASYPPPPVYPRVSAEYGEEQIPLVEGFPEDGRSELTQSDTVKTRKSPDGEVEVLAEERVSTQTSTDVSKYARFRADDYGEYGPEDTVGTITRTIREGYAMGQDGKPVDTSGGSEFVELTSNGHHEPKVTSSATFAWSADGSSTSTYENPKMPHADHRDLKGVGVNFGMDFAPGETRDGKTAYSHLTAKGGDEVENFITSPSDSYSSRVIVSRDPQGELTSEVVEWENLDSTGNGRTVVRNSIPDGPVSWTYQENKDQGRDYTRQTVFEGGNLSVFEEMDGNADGTFHSTTEVTDNGKVLSQYESSRRILTSKDLDTVLYSASGDSPLGDSERLKNGGEPYYFDSTTTVTEATEDDPKLDFRSWSLSNSSGYNMGFSEELVTGEDGSQNSKAFRTVFDPTISGEQFKGTLTESTKSADSSRFRTTDKKDLVINSDGEVLLDGEVIEKGAPLPRVTPESPSWEEPTKTFSSALSDSAHPTQRSPLATHLSPKAIGASGKFGDIVTGAIASHSAYDHLSKGAYMEAAKELEDVVPLIELVEDGALWYASRAGGTSAGAAAWLASKAGTVSKFLGPIGSGIATVAGINDLVNGDSAYDKVGAGVSIAAAGAALIPGVGWAVSLGLSLASLWIANGDAHNTAGMDARLQ